MSSSTSYTTYLLPPIFVGGICFIKNVFGDGYLPENPHVWIDVTTNVTEYIMSKLVIEYSLDKILSGSTFFEDGFNLIAQPILHGVMNGVVKHMMINTSGISGLNYIEGRGFKIPSLEHFTFMNGFSDGVMYDMAGTYLALPITGYD